MTQKGICHNLLGVDYKKMKLFTIAITVAYRSFSTKSAGKPTKWNQSKYKIMNNFNEKTTRTKYEWTNEQMNVLTSIRLGKSVFFTGSAGSGKTLLLEEIIKLLKKSYGPSRVFVAAPTGVAACALKGLTLHSFAGIKFGTDNREDLLQGVLSNRRAFRRWEKVGALVIDEISMVDSEFFDNLEYIARTIRGVDKSWGGIQLVVTGDFFQLPPVDARQRPGIKFAFEADSWNSSFDIYIELTKIFRQTDYQLIKLLQGIRKGECDPEDLQLLNQCCSEAEPDPSVVQLYPLNKDVHQVNEERLKSLQQEHVTYKAVDSGKGPWKRQLRNGIAPDETSLCEGARVLLIKNLDSFRGLVNGAMGTIMEFHKARDVDDICSSGLLPIVKFDSGKTMKIKPETWNIMVGDEVVASRKQMPLILSWALSIHKCQGMTLDSLHTNLLNAFGCGMVYVALSRVRSLKGLHLSGLSPSKIKADPKVLEFYRGFTFDVSGK
ncbi:ATP-dependent DNA helicase [Quillaja saponaria]|uniref:ATP-dependent DNA helicase n=1 Tax=Quillaja saponaria TaxID=32244 RepID=A0AAD7PQK5_QUISA|nr:ATP-dependent DNA helicase [Quillaja saponaria]